MSIKCSYMAVKGRTAAEVAGLLGRILTEEVEHHWDTRGRTLKLSAAELPSGWTLVAASEPDGITPELMSRVSGGGEAIGWFLDERVMYSDAWCYLDGAEAWAIEYNPDTQMAFRGDLPPEFEPIYQAVQKEQAEDDAEGGPEADFIFEVPSRLAATLCGYREVEEAFETQQMSFKVLRRPAREKKPGLFAALFGRR